MSPNDPHTGPWPDDADDADMLEDDELSGAGLAAAIQEDLSELRGISMQFARGIAAKANTPEGSGELVRLNAASAKAARAVRQIAVLQLEIDGQRKLPGTRIVAANQNRSGRSGGPRRPNDRTYGDYRDYTDEERAEWAEQRKKQEEWQAAQFAILKPAMAADFTAAGREDACHESLLTQARDLIMGIPHPAVDEVLKTLDHTFVYLLFGKDNVLPPRLGPGPPGAWEDFDKYAEQRARGRRGHP